MQRATVALVGWLLATGSALWGQSTGALRWLGVEAKEYVGAVIDSPFVVGPVSSRLWNPDSIRWTTIRPPAGYNQMMLYDISWDGRVLAGWVQEAGSNEYFLIRLRREDGTYEVVERRQWYPDRNVQISGDGKICAGVGIDYVIDIPFDIAIFWRGGDTLWREALQVFSRPAASGAYDLSWDGNHVAGRAPKAADYRSPIFIQPVRYTYNHVRRQWEKTFLVPLGFNGAALGISADGKLLVGWMADTTTGKSRAFWWTEQDGARLLPGLSDVGESQAFRVSADGRIIVGRAQVVEYGTQTWHAVRWVNEVIEDLNQTYRALLQDSSVLYDVRAISPSGRYAIGTGYNGRTQRKEWYLLEFWGNNAPRAAYQVAPAESARVGPQPVLEMWGADIEQDSLRFVVELLQGSDTLRLVTGFVYDTARARLQVELPDGWWRWRVRAVDRQEASSPWSRWRSFFISPNQMPTFRILSPEDAARYHRSDTVLFRFMAEDADGDSVRVEIRLERLGTPSEQQLWTQWAASGDTLESRLDGPHAPGEIWWRARVWDNRQGVSEWSQVRLLEFVNRAPLIELLTPPADTLVLHPVWICVRKWDPEGDSVRVELELQHAALGDVVSWSSAWQTQQQSIVCVSVGIPDSVAIPMVQLPAGGTWLWRTRASDEFGGVSEWTPTRRLHYQGVSVPNGQPQEGIRLWVVQQGDGIVVRWSLQQPSLVRLEMFDSYGRLVKHLTEGFYGAGEYSAEIRSEVGSGVYWFRLIAGGRVVVHPVVLLR